MKTGDEVCCIREYSNVRLNINFEVGKYYKIEHIIDFYRNENHTNAVNMNNTIFTLNPEYNKSFHLGFYDYFITKKELRKLKLKKLNNIYG